MPVRAIPPEELRRVCRHEHFTFETTAELESHGSIIGQPRGVRAIEFGIAILSQGYNMFVLGETGTGRTTAIKRFLEQKTGSRSAPPDWLYVNNFSIPHQPRAISLPPGRGAAFKSEMQSLVADLQSDLAKAFDADTYHEAVDVLTQQAGKEQESLLLALQHEAVKQGMALINSPAGPVIAPMTESGEVMTPEQFRELSAEAQQALLKTKETVEADLEDIMRRLRLLDAGSRAALQELNRRVAESALEHHFAHWRTVYGDYGEVVRYLEELRLDVIDHLDALIMPESEDSDQAEPFDLRRYDVNLLVDNSMTRGAPVINEPNPTFPNLVGRMEYEMRFGVMSTHFMNLKAGCLHRANGGYLLLSARDILRHGPAWEALKRAIDGREIQIQTPDSMDGTQVLAKSLDPEPIPLSVKIILLGSPHLYYTLIEEDEDFGELFKVKADFDTMMPRDDAHELEYAHFVADRCREEGLRHFDRPAVEKIIEHGARTAGHQGKLSTRFGELTDVVREASFWAGEAGRDVVSAQDVRKALTERIYRANRVEEKVQESVSEGFVFVATEGAVVGQVNSLSIIDMGDYVFGQPGRITARTYMGKDGVVNIEREVDMAGPIHNKGLLTLVGYLGGQYAQDAPLSFSASLTFEQNYSGVDGDSASAAELFALLSSLSDLPLRQDVAVTGSVNQKGDIQPVGGVIEKIEGFFRVCRERGLTGTQGVMIPAANRPNLMLQEEVIAAVEDDRFHIWACSHIDEGMELLTGIRAGEQDAEGAYPEDSIHGRVERQLLRLAQKSDQLDQD